MRRLITVLSFFVSNVFLNNWAWIVQNVGSLVGVKGIHIKKFIALLLNKNGKTCEYLFNLHICFPSLVVRWKWRHANCIILRHAYVYTLRLFKYVYKILSKNSALSHVYLLFLEGELTAALKKCFARHEKSCSSMSNVTWVFNLAEFQLPTLNTDNHFIKIPCGFLPTKRFSCRLLWRVICAGIPKISPFLCNRIFFCGILTGFVNWKKALRLHFYWIEFVQLHFFQRRQCFAIASIWNVTRFAMYWTFSQLISMQISYRFFLMGL